MTPTRETAIFGLWRRVNEIATTTEDTTEIRNLIAEAGIAPDVGITLNPTDMQRAEWILSVFARMIDEGDPYWIRFARRLSQRSYKRTFGAAS